MDDNSEIEEPSAYAGAPDGFERLWTPHRMVYIQGVNKPESPRSGDCPFCRIQRGGDEEGLIVHRDEVAFVVLNLYPYSPGHVLVCPDRHVADYTELTADEVAAVGALTARAMRVIRYASAPHGFNLGINQGNVAGAGIAAHLHQHVVPRWSGDANFLPVIGQTKSLPQLLGQTWEIMRRAWQEAPEPADRGGHVDQGEPIDRDTRVGRD
ncbi:MAG TPA: HIT domain-containing protein [Microlunatus sp.]|nr:HIT domain-containing protein [Microlunatus sp.]